MHEFELDFQQEIVLFRSSPFAWPGSIGRGFARGLMGTRHLLEKIGHPAIARSRADVP
jgi:hypothetical protein